MLITEQRLATKIWIVLPTWDQHHMMSSSSVAEVLNVFKIVSEYLIFFKMYSITALSD